MVYRGEVRNGVVMLEAGAKLADGTVVRVVPVKQRAKRLTLGQEMLRFAGVAKGLPKDLARNHDHYLHGRPRK